MSPFPADLPDPDGNPSLTELLDNASWLRGVAQQMIGDGRDGLIVDDAIQETWLAALKSGPRQRSSTKAWMSTVVRNFGRQRYRGDARRKAREREAGRAEALPSPGEIHERLELTEQLARFVKELPEPYRRTLVLRFYEERSPAWIAEAEGVPIRTIETRLRRGIQKMRSAFEREHVDSREHWLGSLVLLAFGPHGPKPAPFLPFATGKSLPAILMLVVALSGVALLWQLNGMRDRPPVTELTPVNPAVVASLPSGSELSSPSDGGRMSAAAAVELIPGETRWHGRVIDAKSGSPLMGVQVGLYTRDRDEHIPMRSGPLGNVCTEWDRNLGPTRAHVAATETTRSAKILVNPPGAEETRTQELVVQRRGGNLTGICADGLGTPIPRARVYAWRVPLSGALKLEDANRSVLCDEEGHFDVRDLAGERGNPSRIILMAFTEDLCTTTPLELTVWPEFEHAEIALELTPGWRLQGQIVLGSRGRTPAAGARLEIALQDGEGLPSRPGPSLEQEVRSGIVLEAHADGEGRFDCLIPCAETVLAIASPGYVRQTIAVSGPSDLFIRLSPGAKILGLVTDEGGLPQENVPVRLLERERALLTHTDEFGRFVFAGIEAGSPVALVAGVAKQDLFAPSQLATEALSELWEPVLVLKPAKRLEGVVLGTNGEPLGGVMVMLHGRVEFIEELSHYSNFGTFGKFSCFDIYHTRTDPQGCYVIRGLWEDSFVLEARHFRKGRIIARRTCVPGEPQRPLRAGEGLRECATLRGHAHYADGTPVQRWRLEVSWTDEESGRASFYVFNFDRARGDYELPGLLPGKAQLEAFAELPRETRLYPSGLESQTLLVPGERRVNFIEQP